MLSSPSPPPPLPLCRLLLIPSPGVTEYSFFLASIIGLFGLRAEEATRPSGVTYRTWTGNPVIFGLVSALLIVRAVVAEPMLGLAVVGAGGLGLWVFRAKVRDGL